VKKILLADDSITIQKVVELTFSEGDYQVLCVSNGAQALKKITEVRPDIALLDVIMPEKNGYEVCEQIKRNPATSGIPVLLLTGTFEPFDKKRADAAGANGHLTKPFESQVLVSKVEELIAARPSVVSSEEAGVMTVISGGDLYNVGGGRSEEGMRPVAPSYGPAQAQGGAPGTEGPAFPPRSPSPSGPPASDTAPHPALQSPDPASGGSYVGFADLGVGMGEGGEIVPDRYDDPVGGASPATLRLRRDAIPPRPATASTSPGQVEEIGPDSSFSGERMEGLTGGFEIQDAASPGSPDASEPPGLRDLGGIEEETAWAPPPEAPPAETWQTPEEEPMRAAPAAAPLPGNGAPGLTPEAIDLIAERVVQRMSDRVVREIAWEVIPEVAEAIVRRRIKELEEKGSG